MNITQMTTIVTALKMTSFLRLAYDPFFIIVLYLGDCFEILFLIWYRHFVNIKHKQLMLDRSYKEI